MLRCFYSFAPALLSLALASSPAQAQDGPPVDASFQVHTLTANTFSPNGIVRGVPVGLFYARLFKSGSKTALCGAFSSPSFHQPRNKIFLRGSQILFAAHSMKDLRYFEDMIARRPSLASQWKTQTEALLSGRIRDLSAIEKAGYGIPTKCRLVRGGGTMNWRDNSRRTTLFFEISTVRSTRRKY